MAQGCFRVRQDDEDKRDIYFEDDSAAPDPKPEDQLELKDQIDETLIILRGLYPNGNPNFELRFRSLLLLAQAGLVGPTADPKTAKRSLDSLRRDITEVEGPRIKNQYMRRLGVRSLIFGTAGAVVGIVLWLIKDTKSFAPYFLVWTGSMAGIWLSFGTRKTHFDFKDLTAPEEDKVEPTLRLIFAGILTLVIALAFSTQLLVITIGTFSTDKFKESIEIALLLGILCGISEKALPSSVTRQAAKLFEASGSK